MLDSAEYITQKFSKIMLDPSLVFDPSERPYEELKGIIYIPESFLMLSKDQLDELARFYGPYISRERIQFGYTTYRERLHRVAWKQFNGKEFVNQVPNELRGSYYALLEAEISDTVRSILIDEFTFLVTQSCLLSRLKKTFKLFEKLNALPIINLEERVPHEWVEPVRGMKKCASWIGFIVGSIMLDSGIGTAIWTAIEGIRLVIIDPPCRLEITRKSY
jgi:hypothetical protein